MTEDISNRAEMLSYRAIPMFPRTAESISNDNPYEMYSHDTASDIFWSGFITELLERGLSDEEVEALLRSKNMRWMFDMGGDALFNFAKTMVEDDHIVAARELVSE